MTPRALALASLALSLGTAGCGDDGRTDANPPRLWLGLMNEPYGLTAAEWWPIAQQLVLDLRARSINNYVVVPGTSWTGAMTSGTTQTSRNRSE